MADNKTASSGPWQMRGILGSEAPVPEPSSQRHPFSEPQRRRREPQADAVLFGWPLCRSESEAWLKGSRGQVEVALGVRGLAVSEPMCATGRGDRQTPSESQWKGLR